MRNRTAYARAYYHANREKRQAQMSAVMRRRAWRKDPTRPEFVRRLDRALREGVRARVMRLRAALKVMGVMA